MCGNGILGIGFMFYAAALIALVRRVLSSSISKDKEPKLTYKAYLLATILIGQAMIAAEVIHQGDYAASMLPLIALFWPPASVAVSLMVDRRWCVFPLAYSGFQISSVLYLITRSFRDPQIITMDNYLILLGTLMTLGAVLTFWQIRNDTRSARGL